MKVFLDPFEMELLSRGFIKRGFYQAPKLDTLRKWHPLDPTRDLRQCAHIIANDEDSPIRCNNRVQRLMPNGFLCSQHQGLLKPLITAKFVSEADQVVAGIIGKDKKAILNGTLVANRSDLHSRIKLMTLEGAL